MLLSTSSHFTSASFSRPRHLFRRTVSDVSGRSSAVRPISATTTAMPQSITSTSSLYDVLELPTAATREEIKAAYRRLARSCHPDVSGDCSAEQFLLVRDAYVTLSDPTSRYHYDRSLSSAATLGRSATLSYRTKRTWETDQCW